MLVCTATYVVLCVVLWLKFKSYALMLEIRTNYIVPPSWTGEQSNWKVCSLKHIMMFSKDGHSLGGMSWVSIDICLSERSSV